MDNIRGPVFPEILEELKISDTQGAFFYITTSFISVFTSFYCAKWIQRWGAMALVRWGLGLMLVAFLGYGAATKFWILIVASVIFGLGFGIVASAQNIALKMGASAQHRRQLFSGLHSNYALAALSAPLVRNLFLYLGIGWKGVFMAVSAIPMLVLIAVSRFKDVPIDSSAVESSDGLSFTRQEKRLVLLLSLICVFYLWMEISISSRLVLFLKRTTELSDQEANYRLTLFFVIFLLGRLSFTIKSWPFKNKTILVGSGISSALCIYLGLNFNAWFLSLSALFMAPFFAVHMDFVSETVPDNVSHAIGSVVAFGSLGVVALHFLMGLFSDLFGINSAMYIGVWSAIGLVLGMYLLGLTKKDVASCRQESRS